MKKLARPDEVPGRFLRPRPAEFRPRNHFHGSWGHRGPLHGGGGPVALSHRRPGGAVNVPDGAGCGGRRFLAPPDRPDRPAAGACFSVVARLFWVDVLAPPPAPG